MRYQHSVDNLIKEACASIIYRVKRDILCESIKVPEMLMLQNHIFQSGDIQELVSLQKENGWIGGKFHGEKEPESIIRFFIEKGLEGNNPIIVRALQAILNIGIETNDESLSFGVGKKLDLYHLGGTQMVKSCVFAYAGEEQYDFVKEQILEAMFGFKYVLDVVDIEQVATYIKIVTMFLMRECYGQVYII